MPRSGRKLLLASFLGLAAVPAALHGQRAPTVPMEVFGGRLQLADEIGGGDVDLAGVLAGVDIGAYAGVHGFYWRAVETDPLAAGDVQAFGGEGQVNLNVGNGLTPFLVGGVARLDFLDAEEGGPETPEDRTMPIIGAGVRLDVGRFGLQGAVRSYVADVAVEDGEGSDWVHSPLVTVGAAFRLGRRGGAQRTVAVAPPPTIERVVRGDTVYVVQGDTSYQSQNFVSIPIPREGEIYLRYGPGEGSRVNGAQAGTAAPLDDAALETLRRRILGDLEPLLRGMLAEQRAETVELVRRELAAASPGMTPQAEARLLDRIDALVALRVRDELTAARLLGDSAYAARPAPAVGEREERFVPRVGGLRPYIGGNFDPPRQFVAGLRLDLGPFDAARPAIRLVPEVALGIGQGGASVLLAGNVAYEARGVEVRGTPVRPYGYVGAGFLFINDPPVNRPGTEAVVNLGYGFSVPVPNRSRGELFLEHQGLDFFDLNRVLVGLRF